MGSPRVSALTLVILLAAVAVLPAQVTEVEDRPVTRTPAIPADLLTLPVLFEGREMPLESAAELVLYRLSGRRGFRDFSAAQWLLRLLLDPFSAIDDPVLLVDNPAVFPALGFGEAERGRFAYSDLYPGLPLLRELAVSLQGAAQRDSTEQEIVRLANNVALFEGLASSFDLYRRVEPESESTDSAMTQFLDGSFPGFVDVSELPGMLLAFPVGGPEETTWLTPPGAVARLQAGAETPHLREMLGAWNIVLPAYLLADEAALATGARMLTASIDAAPLPGFSQGRIRLESFHADLQPTRWAGRLLMIGLVIFAILSKSPRRVFWARIPIVIAAVLLTAHQVIRLIITSRPPVTDLPASFQFVAWIIVAVGFFMTLSRAEIARVGVLLSTVSGFSLIYLARLVTGGADIFGVVQAVLDTNFWLTTHVLVITAGYAGVVAAGVAGHIYLFGRIARPHNTVSHQTTYRVMFILLLSGLAMSFLGTILGGVWADLSWGRFWGWDPKENGAALIVLWASVALHARVTRWFDQAAFASASVFGVVVVLFSWLGVNMMGVGLHSYGFSDASFIALVGISSIELLVAVGGWLWLRFGKPEPGLRRVVIESVKQDGDACLITVAGGNGHLPGQHAGIKAEPFNRVRAFSFVDSSHDRTSFLVAGTGPLSRHLTTQARVGDPLWMSGPSGDFVFTTPAGPDVVMVAGGVGIAPIIGLLRRSLEAGHTTTLITANREHSYLAGDLHRLAGEHPDLQIVEVLSRPPASWTGPTGRISTTLVGELLSGLDRTGRGADWYICGSPGFCDTARASAQSLGARRIHEEPFTQAIDPPPAPRFQARVRFNDRRTVVVKQGQTILAAALESGIQLPHSCMSGTCRECVCTVRAGSAVQGARPMEAGEGERILTCVAYPVEPDGLELETAETTEQQNSF